VRGGHLRTLALPHFLERFLPREFSQHGPFRYLSQFCVERFYPVGERVHVELLFFKCVCRLSYPTAKFEGT